MKKTFKTIISFALVALLVLSLSSCSIFEAMRQNALEAAQTTIYATPEEEQIIAEFNNLLAASKQEAVSINENVSYSTGTPDVLVGGEEAGLLDASAKQLKTFIMSAKPGSTSTTLETTEGTLLNAVNDAFVLDFTFTRNIASENVTNEKGENVTDDDGNNVTEQYISDNILHLTFNYFENQVIENAEPETNEDGTEIEETTVLYATNETIEGVFGSLKDKEAVLANFESVKDYITVSDYSIEYTNCSITSDADLEEGRIDFINFTKNMKVTATATGVGALEQYGEFEVVFDLTQTTSYEFDYESELEEFDDVLNETTEAEDETTEAVNETSEAAEETTVEEVADETTADEIEEATEEETVSE